ncbi:MAG: hypothetical protein TE42_01575 [Candidatus Synechococcus spongiarum SP3]|uniref:Uncharacterized protein n=1 Tax=Candidatus Synechococcus spongiarum SP3 TaxID=1604020 RepID=A0A0G2HMD5_9SYNE|nr:MAG: hypothetical protein TE42_01575 [Candidatus Synechococcus spongiarum SP3]
MSLPANAIETPTIGKVWRQLKDNGRTFAAIWGIILITTVVPFVVLSNFIASLAIRFLFPFLFPWLGLHWWLSVTILFMLIAATYYTTDYCPAPGKIVDILISKPLRYLLAGLFLTSP